MRDLAVVLTDLVRHADMKETISDLADDELKALKGKLLDARDGIANFVARFKSQPNDNTINLYRALEELRRPWRTIRIIQQEIEREYIHRGLGDQDTPAATRSVPPSVEELKRREAAAVKRRQEENERLKSHPTSRRRG